MRTLIIDSHKGTVDCVPQNLHWKNSKILADTLGADLIWSYPQVNDRIGSDYDVIIFVHASQYAYIDIRWLDQSPNAKIFYVTNEYNLGEPMLLWESVKSGKRKYKVIANHPPEASKVVKKYTEDWINLNLNALVYEHKPFVPMMTLFGEERKEDCVYYGSFRSDRAKYFKKYLTDKVLLSTHSKNEENFRKVGATARRIDRIDWKDRGLHLFEHLLYIEDEKTHKYYNYLANRFYEGLSYDCLPIFASECINTIEKSGYNIGKEFIIENSDEIESKKGLKIPLEWHDKAKKEREDVLKKLIDIITS